MADVWTPRLRDCQGAINSPGYAGLLQARLLELALGQDGKVAIEALKLLVGSGGGDVRGVDQVLAALPPEQLAEAYERAERFIFDLAGDSSADGGRAGGAGVGAAAVSVLRFTNDARIRAGGASSGDHGGVADGGGGDT